MRKEGQAHNLRPNCDLARYTIKFENLPGKEEIEQTTT